MEEADEWYKYVEFNEGGGHRILSASIDETAEIFSYPHSGDAGCEGTALYVEMENLVNAIINDVR